jgi:anti-anti-sigma factor
MQSSKQLAVVEPIGHPRTAQQHHNWRLQKLENNGKRGYEVIMLRLMSQTMAATAKALHIRQQQAGGIILLRLEGKLTVNTADQLAAATVGVLSSRPCSFIVDLSRVTDMDASGVGELVNIHAEAQQRGSRATFIIPGGRISEMIQLANLKKALEIYSDEKTALAAVTAH